VVAPRSSRTIARIEGTLKGFSTTLFAPSAALKKAVMTIKSDSTPLAEAKTPEGAVAYELYKLVASPADTEAMAQKLRAGGYGWGHAKEALAEALEAQVAPLRARYLDLRRDEPALDRVLAEGAERARSIARRTMARVRAAIGIA